jgi:hypothetical protein
LDQERPAIPEPIYQGLSIYLLLAIGLKGGAAHGHPASEMLVPALVTFALGNHHFLFL